MNKDIDEITKDCKVCQEFQCKQAREPMIPSEVPPRVWHTVGIDLFYFNEEEYLLVADYYSKYQFVRQIPRGSSNSRMVVELLKQIFGEQGVPAIVRSDNGPHFQGQFKMFAEEYRFEHVTSSPRYPRSNGFIESQVKIVKKTLQKAKKSNTDSNMALLCLRSTPIDGQLPSPAELLLGRQVQDNLPRKIRQNPTCHVRGRLQEKQEKQKYYYDQHVKSLRSLDPGKRVVIENPRNSRWESAVIENKIESVPRSYRVSTESGAELRRNRSQIRECKTRKVQFNLHSDSTSKQSSVDEGDGDKNVQINHDELVPCYKTRSGRTVKVPVRLNL